MKTDAPAAGYPLQWPPGRHRIEPHHRDRSNFRTTPGRARDFLIAEVRRLGGEDLVISTNIPLKKDGTPYAGGYRLDDEAVAAYFTYYGKQVCFACDRWVTMAENMHAIGKTIEAVRGIARWGTGDMLNSAVSGFAALPPPTAARGWREVLGFSADYPVSAELIRERYRARASMAHPDKGGSDAEMAELNAARDAALKETA
jgi:hypothetical protein